MENLGMENRMTSTRTSNTISGGIYVQTVVIMSSQNWKSWTIWAKPTKQSLNSKKSKTRNKGCELVFKGVKENTIDDVLSGWKGYFEDLCAVSEDKSVDDNFRDKFERAVDIVDVVIYVSVIHRTIVGSLNNQ